MASIAMPVSLPVAKRDAVRMVQRRCEPGVEAGQQDDESRDS